MTTIIVSPSFTLFSCDLPTFSWLLMYIDLGIYLNIKYINTIIIFKYPGLQ